MTADHPHALWLDGQSRLGGLLLWDDHHRAQVDDASAVGGNKEADELLTVTYPRHFIGHKPMQQGCSVIYSERYQKEVNAQEMWEKKRIQHAEPTSSVEDILSSWTCLYR